MNWQGIIIGGMAFLIIGIFHPIVIKGEYYFSKKIRPVLPRAPGGAKGIQVSRELHGGGFAPTPCLDPTPIVD